MLGGLTRLGTVYDAAVLRFGGRARPGTARDSLWLKVIGKQQVADDVVSLRFGGDGSPPWQPGCHVDLHLPSGLRRQYSLCGDPADASYRIAVRAVGAGSREVQALEVGATVQVRGPRNAFPFAGIGPVVFVAGGIGITAILPMVHAAERQGLDWRLVYVGRSMAAMPFLDELPVGHVDVRIGRGGPLLDRAHPRGAVYCCGPADMLAQVREEVFRAVAALRALRAATDRERPPVHGRTASQRGIPRRACRPVGAGRDQGLPAVGRLLVPPGLLRHL